MILIFHISYIVVLERHIHMAFHTNNAATQYLLAIILFVFSFSINLYRVSIFHEDTFILFQLHYFNQFLTCLQYKESSIYHFKNLI